MSDARPVLAEYCRAGWALVPIPHGKKGPVASKWNTRDMVITDPAIAEWLDGNVGLAHAYSGTCAVDVDDLARATAWLTDRGLDLAALLEAPDAVRIESRPGRAKLLYSIARPLPSYKLGPLELRCASASGLTLQDVLPPSIHPDTGKPYTWRFNTPGGHWSKLPPLPPQLAALWTSLGAQKTKAPKPDKGRVSDIAPRLREQLMRLDPDCQYDDWIAVGMALHHESGGRPSGLALWNEWSSTGKKYEGLGNLELHWRSFRLDHENPKTLASLRLDSAATSDEFPDLEKQAAVTVAPDPRRELAAESLRSLRRSRMGTIEARISNVTAVLGLPELSGWDLALDTFLDAVVISPAGRDEWRPLTDTDYTALRVWLETAGNCDPIDHSMMRHAVQLVAEQQPRDSAQSWLARIEWDGVKRVELFCNRYFGTRNDVYTRAVGRYIWTALAGRVMEPGCQVDMVPVLIGKQGVGKSRGVQSMAPGESQYVELRLDEPDDVIARKTRGALVAEFAEMRGLKAADVERVKAFITRRFERWVPKYKEFATDYPRRFLIIGTTNDEEFLPADTEHRRWLPMHTEGVRVADIMRDRDQLWAEGMALWVEGGVQWRGLDDLASTARASASGEDPWLASIEEWLREHTGRWVRLTDVAVNAVGLDPRTMHRTHELRVGRILRSLGYERQAVRDESGKVIKAWVIDPTA